MSSNPTFSIIMPTYNRAWCITRAITSVLNQTYQDFEIVITDDGSTDDTENVVRGIGDPRIRYYRFDENKNQIEARHNSIIHAKGEWLIFLDSDNELEPECMSGLLHHIDTLEDPKIKVLLSNIQNSDTKEIMVNRFWLETRLTHNPVVTFEDFICSRSIGELFPCVKREVFETVPYRIRAKRNLPIIWHKIARHYDALYIEEILAMYHPQGNDRITNNIIDPKHARWWVDGILEYIDEFQEDILARCPKHMAFHLKSLGIYQYLAGDKAVARKTFARALRYSPLDYKAWVYLVATFNTRVFQAIVNR